MKSAALVALPGPAVGNGTRSTGAELAERVDRAEVLMLSGLSDGRAARALAAEHQVTTRSGMRWVAEVRQRWRDDAAARGELEHGDRHAEHRARFLALYRAAVDAGELRPAILAAERLAQLDGLLVPGLRIDARVEARYDPSPEQREQVQAVLEADFLANGWTPPS